MHKDGGKDGTMIPEFQRDNTQWKLPNRQLMIDSIMHNIPSSIGFGKCEERMEDPWQIIDSHQRLTIVLLFVDDESDDHFTMPGGKHYHGVSPWAKDRFDNYKFTVEKVIAKTDNHLSHLYEDITIQVNG